MELLKVKLKRVFITDRDKEGKPLVSRQDGRPYTRISIQTAIHGDQWLSGFLRDLDDPRRTWKEGDEVTIAVERQGQYLNFRSPSKLDQLEMRVRALETFMAGGKSPELPEPPLTEPPEEGEELPF